MKTKVARWGNSLAIRLPKDAVRQLDLRDGSPVELHTRDRELIVTAGSTGDPELDELIAGITPENRHPLVDWGPPRGREVW